MTTVPHTPGAGVRKPPREETAGDEAAAVPRARRYGDLSAADGYVGAARKDEFAAMDDGGAARAE